MRLDIIFSIGNIAAVCKLKPHLLRPQVERIIVAVPCKGICLMVIIIAVLAVMLLCDILLQILCDWDVCSTELPLSHFKA